MIALGERTPKFLFILLTQGQFACVDFDAPAEVIGRKWYAHWDRRSQTFYAQASLRGDDGRYRTVMLHRVLLGVTDRATHVDHRNHNGLDNRRTNLRLCTHGQNQANQVSRRGVSRFKGVHFAKANQKWCAQITIRQRQFYLGYHETEELAARAYDAAAIEHFGEFACLNFPQH